MKFSRGSGPRAQPAEPSINERRFHPEAEADLDAIWEFIAEDSLEAADRMIDAIEATIEALVPFPHQGHRRPDLTERPLRFTTAELSHSLRAG